MYLLFSLCLQILSLALTNLVFLTHDHPYTINPLTELNPILMSFNISNIKTKKIFKWLGNNFTDYHTEHHLIPSLVPHYYLKYMKIPLHDNFTDLIAPPRRLNMQSIIYHAFAAVIWDPSHLCAINEQKFLGGRAFEKYFIP